MVFGRCGFHTVIHVHMADHKRTHKLESRAFLACNVDHSRDSEQGYDMEGMASQQTQALLSPREREV